MMVLDHIVMGHPCQFWFKRATGAMAPILLNAADAEEVLELWFTPEEEGMEPGEVCYDPESGEIILRKVKS